MPEGHTIHRLAMTVREDLSGGVVRASSPQGRAVDVAEAINGRALAGASAHGKHLFVAWDGLDEVLHVHLGLYGRVRRRRTPPPEPRGLIRLRLVGERRTLDLSGPTACELLSGPEEDDLLARLGPDPIASRARPDRFLSGLARRRSPVGQALLDQALIAGIGNVYRAEALHAVGMDPRRPAASLSREEALALWTTMRRMLRRGVADGHIITATLPRGAAQVPRGKRTNVYRQARCLVCGTEVERFELGARTMYSCPTCQPPVT